MDWLIGGVIAFAVAVVTTPVGVSGAVFLLPVQLSVLHVPSPALTPTNLLFNVIATPGAIVRYRRGGRRATASRSGSWRGPCRASWSARSCASS